MENTLDSALNKYLIKAPKILQPFPLSIAKSDVRSDVFQTSRPKGESRRPHQFFDDQGRRKIKNPGKASTSMVGK